MKETPPTYRMWCNTHEVTLVGEPYLSPREELLWEIDLSEMDCPASDHNVACVHTWEIVQVIMGDTDRAVVFSMPELDAIATTLDEARIVILNSIKDQPQEEEDAETVASLLEQYDNILNKLEQNGASW